MKEHTMQTQCYTGEIGFQPADSRGEPLPHLKDVAKILKDGVYLVKRFVYIIEYDYYIFECCSFKINIYPNKHPYLCKQLVELAKESKALYVWVRQGDYAILSKGGDGEWKQTPGKKADSYAWDGHELEINASPKQQQVDWNDLVF